MLGKSVSSDDAIKAGRIRFEAGDKIEISVEDVDVASDYDVGRHEIEMDKLSIGKNEFKLKKTETSAIRRITLRVLPVGSNIEDLANIMK